MAKSINQEVKTTVYLDGKPAERAYKALEKTVADLNKEREHAVRIYGQESEAVKKLEKEIRGNERAMKAFQQSSKSVAEVISNMAGATEKQLGDAYRTLIKQTKNLDRTTKEYADNKKNIALLRAELDKVNATGKKQISMWDQMGKTAKRLTSYVLVYFGFNKAVSGMQKMLDMNVKLSDQLADIEKTTGLTGRALAELSNDINRIDTRSSVEELNKLAYVAGKLGVTAKEDVLGFVRAGNQINVALGEDLGEDAIKNIAKLNEVMGVTKKLGVEKSLLSTGSAINELGQSSTASEAYLVDFAKRLGGIGSQAGLTIQQILALGSATDQLGQNVEVSATALNKFITTIISKTSQVAKALQIPLDELRAALDRSTWEGVMLVFQKMSERGGLAGLAPIMGDLGSEGARLTAVLSALSANTDILNREIGISNQAFAKATSITEEYNIRNENLAANIEKIGKNIRYWFLGSNFVEWLEKVTRKLEMFTRPSQTIIQSFEDQLYAVRNLTANISPLIDEYDKLKDTQAADEQGRLNEIIAQIASEIPGAVTEWDEYGRALSVSTERAKEFIEQQQRLLRFRNKSAIQETEKFIGQLETELEKQQKVVEEIQSKGGFTTTMYIQTSAFGTGEYKKYFETTQEALEDQIGQYADINEQLREQQKLLRDLSGDYLDDYGKAFEKATGEDITPKVTVDPEETEKELKKRLKKQMEAIDAWLNSQKTALTQARIDRKEYNDEVIDSELKFNQQLEKIEFEALQKRMAVSGLPQDKRADMERKFWDFKLKLFTTEEKETQKFMNELEKVYEQFELKGVSRDQRELIRIQQKYNDATKLLEQALQKQLITEEDYIKYLDVLRAKNIEAEKQYEKERLQKIDEAALKKLNKEQADAELALMHERLEKKEMTELIYKQRLLKIEQDFMKKRLDLENLSDEQTDDLKRKNAERQIQLSQQTARRQEQIQKSLGQTMGQVAQGIGETFGKLFEDNADTWKVFGDSLVDIAFDTMMRLVDIWLDQMEAKAAIDTAQAASGEVATKGFLGIATGAALAGVIKGLLAVARAGIKSLIGKGGSSEKGATGSRVVKSQGFDTGGYSGDGGKYDPAGIVHRGEYIVPQIQMKDPVSFSMVRALESIRVNKYKQNTNKLPGYATGGGVDTTIPVAASESDPELKRTLSELNKLLAGIKRTGLQAYLNYSNLKDTENRINQSIKRGSRPK